MTNQHFDATVVIGRFQPFHKGHLSLIRKAMTLAPLTCVLLGSHNAPCSAKNIWSTEERLRMMKPCFTSKELHKLIFLPIPDFDNDQKWVHYIQQTTSSYLVNKQKIALIGYLKDASSYYLKIFPQWKFIQAEKFCDGLSATDLRHAYFDGLPPDPTYLPDPVIEFLCDFRKNPSYETLKSLVHSPSPLQVGTHA